MKFQRLLIFLILVGVFLGLTAIQMGSQEDIIKEELQAKGATDIIIEKKSFDKGAFAFSLNSSSDYIYKVTYTLDGEERISWVRFGPFKKTEWRD